MSRIVHVVLGTVVACGKPPLAVPDGGGDAPGQGHEPPTITSTVDFTRFVTRDHMLASAEMQISGEPLAEAMGRDLGGYSRDLLPADIYLDAVNGTFWIDL